jgi:hypothetical protein
MFELTNKYFPHINSLISTCAQNMFDGINAEKEGIPLDFINPPIRITSNKFAIDISERQEKHYSIISFHSPLNITINTMAPLGWCLNAKTIDIGWNNLFMIMNRIPIFLTDGKNWIGMCFSQFYENTNDLKTFFEFMNINNMKQKIPTIENIINKVNPVNGDELVQRADLTKYNANTKEEQQMAYRSQYSDGQYTGLTSPQANDFYQANEENVNSNFNKTTPLKCIFEIALLANIYGTSSPYYTLTTGCVIIYMQGENLKYTGKYWLECLDKAEDKDDNGRKNVKTVQLYQRVYNYISNKQSIKDEVQKEIGINLVANDNLFTGNNIMGYNTRYEYEIWRLASKNEVLEAKFAMNLFNSTLGLETFLKQELALFLSGVLGHHYDTLLRYFVPGTDTVEIFNKFKELFPTAVYIKHYGTPIASYLYDFKNGTQAGLLGGYNAVNFSRVIGNKILSINDKLMNPITYNPPKVPNCLIPITYNNAILQCKTRCYRSYKSLLKFLRTRKQRNWLFDHLTHFGRRAMTVLDPYGIFMHFHNDQKGIQPS